MGSQPSKSLQTSSQEESTSLTQWRSRITVSIQRSRKVRGGNFVQISTVDPKTMEPRCRTVVFRGFLGTDGDDTTMKMITDRRSSKVSEVSSVDGAGSSDGNLLTVRKAQWGNLSDSAREQFYWKEPSIPYQSDAEGGVPTGGRSAEGKVLPPP